MKVYHSIADVSAKNPVVTIGMFDGVHAGHRAILKQLEESKKQCNGESVLLTFWPHPRVFFGKTDGFSTLTTIEEKLHLLEQTGLDVCVVLPFSKEFASLSPEEYIRTILVDGLKAKKIVIGYDHKYGKNGLGTFDLMKQFGRVYNFEVEEINAFSFNSDAVSSTKIRRFLGEGNIEKANKYLSYNYFIQGSIIHGSQIGRTIGFPTANIQIETEYKTIPANGVYAGYSIIDNKKYKAVINIGNKPTVSENNKTSIEVHLIDFQRDLYNETLQVSFVFRLRDEQKFESLDALKKAIQHDVDCVRTMTF